MSVQSQRLIQLQKQVNGIMDKKPVGKVVSYQERDPVTGERSVLTADGGIVYTDYLSNTVPSEVFTSYDGVNINQKPGTVDNTYKIF